MIKEKPTSDAVSPLNPLAIKERRYYFQRPLYQFIPVTSWEKVKPFIEYATHGGGRKIIENSEYYIIKILTKTQIEHLELELQYIASQSKELNIKTKIENALDSMENLSNLYQQGDLLTKRTIGCLIFPEKVEFDGKSFQTPKMNIVAQCIYQYNSELGNKKNRHKRVKTPNVGLVTSTGFKHSEKFAL